MEIIKINLIYLFILVLNPINLNSESLPSFIISPMWGVEFSSGENSVRTVEISCFFLIH